MVGGWIGSASGLLVPSAPLVPNGLLDNLVYCYELNETSGTRADSHTSGLTLTDNNTVLSTPGKVGNAALFVKANAERLTHADNAIFDPGSASDFEFTFWVKYTTLPTSGQSWRFIDKINGNTGYRFTVYNDTGTIRMQWTIGNADQGQPSVTATTFGAPSTDTWYFVNLRYATATRVAGISINRGTFDEMTMDVAGPTDSTAAFSLGGRTDGADYLDGAVDQLAHWSALLDDTKRDLLYNSGNGWAFSKWTS